ncbi:MAG: hypothetical protein KAJ33_07085, partial [Thermoplasmata archaeon]|nr:hypothetical protein [Thermoplasmata archaeon]
MKKIAVLIMSFMLVASGFVLMLDMNVEGKEVVPAPLFTGEGSGTVADPYEITDIDQLQEMNDDLNANYTLMNDIDAKITSTWNIKSGFQPVGNNTAYFNGTLNGNGYAISNLTINRSAEDHVGLFGYLNQSASIDDLGLENGNITGHQYVGGLVGRNYGNVMNSYSTVNITGDNGVGGFAGRNEQGTITNCYSTGNATAGGGVGGFAGHNFGAGSTITDCYSTGNVVAGTGDATGGFIGFTNSGSITNCYSSGNVTGIGMVGGFVGADGGATTNCYSTGNADGSSDSVGGFAGLRGGGTTTNCYSTGNAVGTVKIGGFAGWSNSAIIKNSYSTGSASGTDYVGGFNGITDSFGNIENCYSTGSSTGTAGNIGGFIGANWQGVIMNSYSTGIATGTGADVDNIGGFVGQNNDGSISNSYSNGNAIGPDSDSAFVGGFAGRSAATISNCYSTGSATTPGDVVGGFTGRNDAAGVITDSYALGDADITGSGWEIGGFTGQNHGSIERCYSLGDATTAGGGIAGGFVGKNYNIITDCFAWGNADASTNYVGGFAGWNNAGDTITNCYSTGTASFSGTDGGFVGQNDGTIAASHWDTTTSSRGAGFSVNNGAIDLIGHTTPVMKQQGTFSGWDFANVWGIVQDNTYPFLTTIDPIIINEQITQIGMATEDVEYSMDFNSTVQPIPF